MKQEIAKRKTVEMLHGAEYSDQFMYELNAFSLL